MKRKAFSTIVLSLAYLLFLSFTTMVEANIQSRIERLSGSDRFKTSVAISQNGWETADNVIVVYGRDFPDALCATPLAKKLDAPILLSEKNRLTAEVEAELIRLNPKNIFIIGGTAVVNESVVDQIKTKLPTVAIERISGSDRIETSLKVAEKLGFNGNLVVAYGWNYADALSIAPIAAKQDMPIILTRTNQLQDSVVNFLNGKTINKAYIVGGTGVVSDNVKNSLKNVERINGINRFETNYKIIEKFKSEMDFENVYVAIGIGDGNFADALSASSLVAKKNGVLVLINNTTIPENAIIEPTKDLIKQTSKVKTNIIALGGEMVVPQRTVESILNQQLRLTINGNYKTDSNIDVIITGNDVKYYDSNINANIYIYGNKAHLQNLTVDGEVIVDPGSNGEATLENVKATKVTILSGAQNSIHLVNSEVENVEVNTIEKVRLVVEGTTRVQKVEVKSDAKIEVNSQETQIEKIEVASDNTNTVEFTGQITSEVEVKSSAKILVENDSKLENIKVTTNTEDTVEISGQAGNLVVQSETNIKLTEAIIDKVVANESVQIVGDENSQIIETEGQGEIKTDGGVIVGQTKPVESFEVFPREIYLKQGETTELNIFYEPQDTTDKLEIYCEDSQIAEVTADGQILAKTPGETEVVVKMGGNEARVRVVVEENEVINENTKIVKVNIYNFDMENINYVTADYSYMSFNEEGMDKHVPGNKRLNINNELILNIEEECNEFTVDALNIYTKDGKFYKIFLNYNYVDFDTNYEEIHVSLMKVDFTFDGIDETSIKHINIRKADEGGWVSTIGLADNSLDVYIEKGEYNIHSLFVVDNDENQYCIIVNKNIDTINRTVNASFNNLRKLKIELLNSKIPVELVISTFNNGHLYLNTNNEIYVTSGIYDAEYIEIAVPVEDKIYYYNLEYYEDLDLNQDRSIQIDLGIESSVELYSEKNTLFPGQWINYDILHQIDNGTKNIYAYEVDEANIEIKDLEGNVVYETIGENAGFEMPQLSSGKYVVVFKQNLGPLFDEVVTEKEIEIKDYKKINILFTGIDFENTHDYFLDYSINEEFYSWNFSNPLEETVIYVEKDVQKVFIEGLGYHYSDEFNWYSYSKEIGQEIELNGEESIIEINLAKGTKSYIEIYNELVPNQEVYYNVYLVGEDGKWIKLYSQSQDKVEILRENEVIYETTGTWDVFTMPQDLAAGVYTLRITRDMGPLYGDAIATLEFEINNALEQGFLELNVPYVSPHNGMTVVMNDIQVLDQGGYYDIVINYTETNETTDLVIAQEGFKLFLTNSNSKPQYGFFNYLYPGQSVSRTYTFSILKSEQPLCVEYGDNFFNSEPMIDSLKWKVEIL